jgi:capsid portal protein
MSAYSDACKVEARAWMMLAPWMDSKGYTVEDTKKHPFIQKYIGDKYVTAPDGVEFSLEMKAEESNKYGNLFLETWSNYPHKPGWIVTTRAEYIWYCFLEQRELHQLVLEEVKGWFRKNNGSMRELVQRKRQQRNDTRGVGAPIAKLSQLPSYKLEIIPAKQ